MDEDVILPRCHVSLSILNTSVSIESHGWNEPPKEILDMAIKALKEIDGR